MWRLINVIYILIFLFFLFISSDWLYFMLGVVFVVGLILLVVTWNKTNKMDQILKILVTIAILLFIQLYTSTKIEVITPIVLTGMYFLAFNMFKRFS